MVRTKLCHNHYREREEEEEEEEEEGEDEERMGTPRIVICLCLLLFLSLLPQPLHGYVPSSRQWPWPPTQSKNNLNNNILNEDIKSIGRKGRTWLASDRSHQFQNTEDNTADIAKSVKLSDEERLQKVISRAGIASRREAEKMILDLIVSSQMPKKNAQRYNHHHHQRNIGVDIVRISYMEKAYRKEKCG